MAIDRELPPTNELLLKCGPEGTREPDDRELELPILDVKSEYIVLELGEMRNARRTATMHIELVADEVTYRVAVCKLPLGHVTTIGQVIDLYELLSQKEWPGK